MSRPRRPKVVRLVRRKRKVRDYYPVRVWFRCDASKALEQLEMISSDLLDFRTQYMNMPFPESSPVKDAKSVLDKGKILPFIPRAT